MSSKATSLKTFHSNAGLNRWIGNDARRWEAKFKRTGVVKNLHVGSGWSYLSDAEFEALTWAPLSLVHPPLRAGATVFEAGVGVGAALRVLLQRVGGLSLAGCDVQPDTLRVARRVLPPGTSLFHCNFSERMPLPDESFDVTASFGALSMYASSVEEMRAGVAELARLARPCGTMVVTQVAPPLPPGRVSGTARLSLPWDFWREAAAGVGLTDVRFVAHSDVMRHFGKGHPRFAKSRRFQSERYSVVATKRCAAAAVAASEADHRAEYSTAPSRTTPPTSQHGVRCPAPWSGSASRAGQRLALEKAVGVLASCGAPYLLDNGALLGFWRKCDFLDADLDITVPASWWSIAGNRRCVNVGLPGVGMTSLRARHFGRLRSGAGSVYQESWWLSHNGTINSDVSMGHALLQRDPVLGLPDTIQKRGAGVPGSVLPPTEWLRRAVVGWTSGAGSIAYARLPRGRVWAHVRDSRSSLEGGSGSVYRRLVRHGRLKTTAPVGLEVWA